MKTKWETIIVGSLVFVIWGCSPSDQPPPEPTATTTGVTRVPSTTLPAANAGGYTTSTTTNRAIATEPNPAVTITNAGGGGTNTGTPATIVDAVAQQTNMGKQVVAGTLSGDQAENELDLGIVQGIRKVLETDKDLSPIAGKIRIACANGQVILSGTVPDQLTKMAVADKAKSVAGVKAVDNRLEIGS